MGGDVSICLGNVSDANLRARGEHRYFETHGIESTPGAGEVVGINVEINGGVVTARGSREGVVLDKSHFFEVVRLWNHGERRRLERTDVRFELISGLSLKHLAAGPFHNVVDLHFETSAWVPRQMAQTVGPPAAPF
jgi:hypothetical protein